jgi:steroid 5-alpha reductase family enzyme
VNSDTAIFVLLLVGSAALLALSRPDLVGGLPFAIAIFTAAWCLSLALRNAGIVDILWGLGFIAIAWFAFVVNSGPATPRALLVAALTTVWGLRLALHIGIRNAGAGEDHRYAAWREESGSSFWWVSYFKVFLLQAVILWVVSSPLALVHTGSGSADLAPMDLVGLGLWLVGFSYETVADWQLARFKREPSSSGKVMRSGLWSLSRHPNYFGEAVLWWGIGILVLPAAGWLSLIGPALITFLLLRISGVALLDRTMVERRPAYADYIRDTPAFLPIPRFLR